MSGWHHQALYRAMRMKRAAEDDLGEVRDNVLEFWVDHGAKHFRIELVVRLVRGIENGAERAPTPRRTSSSRGGVLSGELGV